MAKKRSKDGNRGVQSVPTSDTGTLKSNPFGALAGLSVSPAKKPLAEGDGASSSEGSPATRTTVETEEACRPTRAIVSYQRKGRGGKEVTLVELRSASPIDVGAWLSRIKKALGCGGFVEDGRIVVTGDQRQRLRSYLAGRGVKHITVS